MSPDESPLDQFTDDLQATILRQALERYGSTVVDHWMNPRRWGPMEKPEGFARYKGPCGDTMQVWLRIAEGRIEDASFMTDGCGSAIASGSAVAALARGRTIEEAELVDQDAVLEFLGGLPDEDRHCALLAATTLYRALNSFRSRISRENTG